MGGICMQKQDFEEAEQHYELAAQYPLRTVNDHVAAWYMSPISVSAMANMIKRRRTCKWPKDKEAR
jgi:hypothetical protein